MPSSTIITVKALSDEAFSDDALAKLSPKEQQFALNCNEMITPVSPLVKSLDDYCKRLAEWNNGEYNEFCDIQDNLLQRWKEGNDALTKEAPALLEQAKKLLEQMVKQIGVPPVVGPDWPTVARIEQLFKALPSPSEEISKIKDTYITLITDANKKILALQNAINQLDIVEAKSQMDERIEDLERFVVKNETNNSNDSGAKNNNKPKGCCTIM